MRTRPWLIISALPALLIWMASTSEGAVDTAIYIKIGSGAEFSSTSIPLGTYSDSNGKRIEVITAGTIVRDDASPMDTLTLQNLKIKALDNVTAFPITIRSDFAAPPMSTSQDVYYRTSIRGMFNPTAQAGNSVTVNQSVAQPPDSTPVAMGGVQHVVCSPSTLSICWNFIKSSAHALWNNGQNGPLNDDRRLKLSISVSLSVEKTLEIGTGQDFVMANTTGSGDTKEEETCKVPNCPPAESQACSTCTQKAAVSWFCATTHNTTGQTFRCPECVSEDGIVSKTAQAKMFARNSWDSLSQDMAKGSGEYLAAFANLLKVPTDQQPQFFALAQYQFTTLSQQGLITPENMVATLRGNLSQVAVLEERRTHLVK